MKAVALTIAASIICSNAYAYNERDVSLIAKKYSETVACQLDGISQYQKNQYKAVKVAAGDPEMGGFGAVFVVYWEGDVGCSGGNGTIGPNFTILEHSGFMSAMPVVNQSIKFPQIDLVSLTSITSQNGVLLIKGVTYGPNDQQHQPKKSVSYSFKYVEGKFIKQ